MSVRAYRVDKKELAENSSFNCWHDTDILDFFVQHRFWDGRNDDGCGSIEVSVATLKKFLSEYEWHPDGDDQLRNAIAADIAWARKNDRVTVEYDCF